LHDPPGHLLEWEGELGQLLAGYCSYSRYGGNKHVPGHTLSRQLSNAFQLQGGAK